MKMRSAAGSGADDLLLSKESVGVADTDALFKAFWRDTPEERRKAVPVSGILPLPVEKIP